MLYMTWIQFNRTFYILTSKRAPLGGNVAKERHPVVIAFCVILFPFNLDSLKPLSLFFLTCKFQYSFFYVLSNINLFNNFGYLLKELGRCFVVNIDGSLFNCFVKFLYLHFDHLYFKYFRIVAVWLLLF